MPGHYSKQPKTGILFNDDEIKFLKDHLETLYTIQTKLATAHDEYMDVSQKILGLEKELQGLHKVNVEVLPYRKTQPTKKSKEKKAADRLVAKFKALSPEAQGKLMEVLPWK